MKYNNIIKELFTVFIFSLFIFANPLVNTISFDMTNASEIMLEADEAELEEDENEKESKNAFFFKSFALLNFSSSTQSAYQIHSHTYRNNTSLLKPPIL